MMQKVFLIGGSGFIGKNLALFLYSKYEVFIFDKYVDKAFFCEYKTIITYELDLINDEIPTDFGIPDYIINLVSIVNAERHLSLFGDLISSNLQVLLNLYSRFNDSTELKLFVQFGSSEEYGSALSPFREDYREQPNSPYALVKQLTTNTSLMLFNNYDFPITIVRPGNLFGRFQSDQKFIPYIISKLQKNLEINVTECEQKRDFIYIDDFVYLINLILKNFENAKGEILNVSSGISDSLKEIIEFCKVEIGSTSIINYGALPYRKNEAMNLLCDVSKLKRVVNEDFNLDIKVGLTRFIKENQKK